MLESAIAYGDEVEIKWVVIGKDPSVTNDFSEEIYNLANSFDIPIYQRDCGLLPECQLSIAASWRWLIPLDEKTPLVIMHDSLLPKLRGFNPLVTALIEGDTEVGVTAILAGPQFDQGNILAQAIKTITYPIKIGDAIDLITDCYKQLVSEVLELCQLHKLNGCPQDEQQATYSLWRDDFDYFVDWNNTASFILRFIDAVGSPYLGARVKVGNEYFVIHEANLVSDVRIVNRFPGKLLRIDDGNPTVICGEGLIQVTKMTYLDTGLSSLPWPSLRTRFESLL